MPPNTPFRSGRLLIAATSVVALTTGCAPKQLLPSPEDPAKSSREGDLAAVISGDDAWNSVMLTVARNNPDSQIGFYRSLELWAHPRRAKRAEAGKKAEAGKIDLVLFDGDLTAPTVLPGRMAVHIFGDLAAQLQVGKHAEVVIGGSILRGGRIDAEDIVAIHVQKDVEGTVACRSSAELWVGGDLRSEVLTGAPRMHIHIAGNLSGSVRPMTEAAGLYIGVGGYAASSTLAAIDSHHYLMLEISVEASDTRPGIYPLSTSRSGFVAVTGAPASKAGPMELHFDPRGADLKKPRSSFPWSFVEQ